MTRPAFAVFDVGNVLIRWEPRELFAEFYPDEAAIDAFLGETQMLAWNLEFDRGLSVTDGTRALAARFPHHAAAILAFDQRWQETVTGAIEGTVAVLQALRAAGQPTYGITNFSAEKFAESQLRFPFLAGFDDVVVSAHERLVKPDPAIYRVLLARNGLAPEQLLFIDDSLPNIEAARALGFHTHHFIAAEPLAHAMREMGFPV